MLDGEFLGFPRRTCHVLLPSAPLEAARAGLALYDNTLLHQRIVRFVGSALLDLRFRRVFAIGRLPEGLLDRDWWIQWRDEIAAPIVGPIAHAAFRLWEGRVVALLLSSDGRPRGFVKAWPSPPGPPRPTPYLQPLVLSRLAADPPRAFRVPAFLAEGVLDGWAYQLFEPLPAGPHRPLAPDRRRISGIFDEIRERLSTLPRPGGVPLRHVVGHGDFTPRNVRVAGDGRVWILDWEYACWAPALADELNFWTAWFSCRPWPRPERDGRRTLSVLRERGTDDDIAEAVRWGAYMTPAQRAIADVVGRVLAAGAQPAAAHGGAHA